MPKEQREQQFIDKSATTKRQRGRPISDNPMTMRVDVTMTKEELDMLDRYCQIAGVSRPQGLRDGIRNLIKNLDEK